MNPHMRNWVLFRLQLPKLFRICLHEINSDDVAKINDSIETQNINPEVQALFRL